MERFILSTKADNGFELNAWLEPDPHGPYVLFSSADAQTALLEAWKRKCRAEHSLRMTLDSVLASVREGDEIGEKMTSESLWAQLSELKAAEQHLRSLGEKP